MHDFIFLVLILSPVLIPLLVPNHGSKVCAGDLAEMKRKTSLCTIA